jgi:spore maturation protein CgeB
MVASGFSPSVRLFEAAACACPIISDYWKGLDTVFQVGREILVAENSNQVTSFLNDIDDAELRCMAALARERVLAEHSSAHRAEQFENHVASARDSDSETNLTLATSLAAQRHVPLIN